MTTPARRSHWLVRMHYRMRTVSFAMVFLATALHLTGAEQGASSAVWVFSGVLLLLYPQLQFLRSRSAANPIRAEMQNLIADSVLLGALVAAIQFSEWLSFSVVMGTLSNNVANRGWEGIRDATLALLAGLVLGACAFGFQVSTATDPLATLVCMAGLGGYLLTISNIGHFRNRQLRDTRETLETRERELTLANVQLSSNLREIDQLQDQLRDQANRDALTGLYNRRFLAFGLEREMVRCAREAQDLSVIMMDVDNFKLFNDHYGHLQGDECLRQVAKTLTANAKRASDLVARYGGEEFCIVLPDTDAGTACRLAENLRVAIEALNLPHSETAEGRVTISLGVATMAAHSGWQADDLMRSADAALYQAKRQGRNQVSVVQ